MAHTRQGQCPIDPLDLYAAHERRHFAGYGGYEAEMEMEERKAAIADALWDYGVDISPGRARGMGLWELRGMLEEARAEWRAARPEEGGAPEGAGGAGGGGTDAA